MAIQIPGSDIYSLLILADGTKIKMPEGMWSRGNDQIRIYIFPEGRTVEEVEQIFKDVDKTHSFKITDKEENFIFSSVMGHTVFHSIEKLYKEAFRTEYNEKGEPQIYTTDLFVVVLRKPSADDLMPKFQSDLEYVAILSDIDLDEDIYKD